MADRELDASSEGLAASWARVKAALVMRAAYVEAKADDDPEARVLADEYRSAMGWMQSENAFASALVAERSTVDDNNR